MAASAETVKASKPTNDKLISSCGNKNEDLNTPEMLWIRSEKGSQCIR